MNNPKKALTFNEAKSDFNELLRLAAENGVAKILVDGQAKYALVDLDKSNFLDDLTDDEVIDVVSRRVLKEYKQAFEELAK